MPRGSDKHSPRIDDNLDHDLSSLTRGAPVESRAQEARTQEGAADDEPTPDARLTGDRAMADDDVLSPDEIETRSLLAAHLAGTVWPADREALVAQAGREFAPEWLVDRLSSLPAGTFTHTEAVWEALGGRVEFRP